MTNPPELQHAHRRHVGRSDNDEDRKPPGNDEGHLLTTGREMSPKTWETGNVAGSKKTRETMAEVVDKEEKLPRNIAIGCIGGVVGLALLLILSCFIRNKRKGNKKAARG